MKRVGYGALLLLVGILFPFLIWVALFTAIRETLLRVMRRVAWAALGLLTGILFPLLIWAGLGVAVREWMRERMLQRRPRRTVAEILAAAGLSIQWEATGDKSLAAAAFAELPVQKFRNF